MGLNEILVTLKNVLGAAQLGQTQAWPGSGSTLQQVMYMQPAHSIGGFTVEIARDMNNEWLNESRFGSCGFPCVVSHTNAYLLNQNMSRK